MRPLETHVELSSQLWMFNRVKEMLTREGLIRPYADDEEVCTAIARWTHAMAEASHDTPMHMA